MTVEWFRDFGIGMFTWLATIFVIALIVIAVFLFFKVKAIINSIKHTVGTVEDTVVHVKDQIMNPIIQLAAFVQVLIQYIERVRKVFTKTESDKESAGNG